jgi:hypothetical protein
MVFEYKGTPVMACKVDEHWQVRAHGNVYAFRFLDQALSAALPSLTHREVDRLVISLIDQEMERGETLFDAA